MKRLATFSLALSLLGLVVVFPSAAGTFPLAHAGFVQRAEPTLERAAAGSSLINRAVQQHIRTRHVSTAGVRSMNGPPGDIEPVPLPGFLTFPPFPDEVHAFFPGFLGDDPDLEPSAITNFRGFTALAYHVGTAMGSDGNEYLFFTDMRVFQGEYVSADGTHHRGTFVLI